MVDEREEAEAQRCRIEGEQTPVERGGCLRGPRSVVLDPGAYAPLLKLHDCTIAPLTPPGDDSLRRDTLERVVLTSSAG